MDDIDRRILRELQQDANLSTAQIADRVGLSPWSDAWERYCKRAHRDFDPERGTYTGDDGTERFCTGE